MTSLETARSFELNGPIRKCYDFLTNVENIARCIPGCEEVRRLSDTEAELKVKVKAGYVAKSITAKTAITEAIPPTQLKFTGTSLDATLKGEITLEDLGDKTKVTYTIRLKAISAIAATALTFMGKGMIDQQADEFINCLKQRINSS